MSDDPLNEAIQLIKAGKKDDAKRILEPFIRANPHNIQAWLWEAETRETLPGKIKILELCLRFNPDEQGVKTMLEKLNARLEAENSGLVSHPAEVPFAPPLVSVAEPQQKKHPCPYCAELILKEAVVCPFCGRNCQTGILDASREKLLPIAPQTVRARKGAGGCGVVTVIVLIVLGVIFYNVFGFFTIQPIGAIPDGVTMLIVRSGTQLQFFDSPDAMCERVQGGVSILCRLGALGALADKKEIILLRLPYVDAFYLLSTGGATYDR